MVSDQDDKPLSTTKAQVSVTITMFYDTKTPTPPLSSYKRDTAVDVKARNKRLAIPLAMRPAPKPLTKTYTIGPKVSNVPLNGIVPISFTPPSYINRVQIRAEYSGMTETNNLEQFHSRIGTYLQASLITPKPKAGRRCTFRIESTESRKVVNYMIISKSIVVTVDTLYLRWTRQFIHVMMTSDMAPSSRLIVYYVTPDAEVVADSVMFEVEGLFENQVDISYSLYGRRISRGQPGSDVTITVEEELESYDTVRPPPCVMMPMMSMNKASGAVSPQSPSNLRVRTKFPETWVYQSIVASARGEARIDTKIPDTITSWVASAFAVHPKSGLGIVPQSATLEAFLHFFVRLDLPYSVVRGEQVILQADVFNFFTIELEVTVTLKKSNGFQNILVERDFSGASKVVYVRQDIVYTIKVSPGDGVAVRFPIKTTAVGTFDVEVRVVSPRAGDAVRKQLLIVPEGMSMSYAISVLIDLRNPSRFKEEVDILVPGDAVPDSVHIAVSLIGDMMGPTITGLADLLHMPHGCGEQNMITFVPNIVVANYLEAIGGLTPVILNKAKGYMIVGYQSELTFRHHDGSFSAFGNNDASGSTWLTAFVVKSFAQASFFIYVDPGIVRRAIDWVLDQYAEETATFNEPGRVIHYAMMGGTATSRRNLAAYVITALLEAKENEFFGSDNSLFDIVVGSALNNLLEAVDDMEDPYELAISGYAFFLANMVAQVDEVWLKLQDKKIEENDTMHWSVGGVSPTPGHHSARTSDIETTAYVLFLYTGKKYVTDGLKIVKWLIKQRNPYGGFGSTQDTVVALQALAGMAALQLTYDLDMTVDVMARPSGYIQGFNINSENALVMQNMQISVSYNIMAVDEEPMFELSLKFTDETMFSFRLTVCFRWLGSGSSGMAVLELGLLSGFEPGAFDITDLPLLKRVERTRSELSALDLQNMLSERETTPGCEPATSPTRCISTLKHDSSSDVSTRLKMVRSVMEKAPGSNPDNSPNSRSAIPLLPVPSHLFI
ncbi:CD109-like protein [Mya arenaria]|uniref:CD109-like protein n=1 Tax=Mya arenaria TaxID=6604 RepID=A0ABY7DJI7_MYAAR|nr:CD109-like protein [Mya arenaria]